MRVSAWCLLLPKSVYGRLRVISRQRRLPVAQSIAAGVAESRRIKDAAKRKVAWQHASPMFESYSRFLELALVQASPSRLLLVTKRMLNDNIKQGKPTGVTHELLDRCCQALFTWILDNGDTSGKSLDCTLSAIDCLVEIRWRLGFLSGKPAVHWTLLDAAASDRRGKAADCTRALASLVLTPLDVPLISRVLKSTSVSTQFLSELHSRVKDNLGMDRFLATAFYASAMARQQHQKLPKDIAESMLAHSAAAFEAISSGAEASGVAGVGDMALSLAHLYVCQQEWNSLHSVLAHFPRLTIHAQWPMAALAIAISKMLDLGRIDCIYRLLEVFEAKDNIEFGRLLGEQSELDTDELKLALLDNELDIALSSHKAVAKAEANSKATILPRAAFFAPRLKTRLGDSGIADRIEQHYDQVDRLLQFHLLTARLGRRLVAEAASWRFRLQSPLPLVRLTRTLCGVTLGGEDTASVSDLLQAYTRSLRNFALTRLSDHIGGATTGSSQYASSIATLCSSSSKHAAEYEDIQSSLSITWRAVLAEYLRHGLVPSPEVLAIFHSLLAASNHPDATGMALRILPEIRPSMVHRRHPGHLAAQAYYEHMLLSVKEQPRRLLQLFLHLMGHHGAIDSPAFLRRLVDLTVVTYLRHGYFHGMGVFRLERAIVRCVDRPRFSGAYLNVMRARFWALHMFLRRRKYVPRFKLYRWQFNVHRHRLYRLRVTPIPSKAKLAAQRVATSITPKVEQRDIEAAVNIFLRSTPRNKPGAERYSLTWMLDHQTQMVVAKPRGSK